MAEAYARFKKGLDVPKGMKITAQRFEADGHRFFVLHDTSTANAMAELTRGWEDICTFETVPVITPEELLASL